MKTERRVQLSSYCSFIEAQRVRTEKEIAQAEAAGNSKRAEAARQKVEWLNNELSSTRQMLAA